MNTGQINPRSLLDWAQYYVSKGFLVIPLRPKSKQPIIKWKEFQNRKPTPDELERWFKDGQNNIAIITGKISGITVVDLDSGRAVDFAQNQQFPETPEVISSKGAHLYYKYASGTRNIQNSIDLRDIDLRSDGGYIVAPPSIHPSGTPYRWSEGCSLDDLEFADLPEIFLKDNTYKKQPVGDLTKGVEKGKRNNSLASLVGSWIAKGDPYDRCLLMARGWNTLNRPPLDVAEVERTVKSIFATHNREKKSKPEKADFEVTPEIEDTEKIFIFENEDDVKYFNELRIKNSCGVCMSYDTDGDLEFLKGKDVVIYQPNSNAKVRVTEFAEKIIFAVPVRSIKVLESPIDKNFTHWFEEIIPYGLESLQILSDPQIPIRIEELMQDDTHPLRRYNMSLTRKDPLLSKKGNIEISLQYFSDSIMDGGYKKYITPSPDIIKNRYDTFYYAERQKIIMDPWLDDENITLVSSDAGVGKTWFLLEIANACAKGEAAFNGKWKVESPIDVLYVDGEMPPGKWTDRLDLIKTPPNLKYISKMLWELEGIEPPLDLDNPKTREYLNLFILMGKYKLVIFDNIISLISNYTLRGDEAWGEINNWLLKLRANKVSVILAHHNKKGMQEQIGTIVKVVNLDSYFSLIPKSKPGTADDMCKFKIRVAKDRERSATGLSKLVFTFDDGVWSVEEAMEESKAEKFKKEYGDKLPLACRMLMDGEKQKDIASEINVTQSFFSSTLKPYLLGKKDEEAWLLKVDGGYELTEYGRNQVPFWNDRFSS